MPQEPRSPRRTAEEDSGRGRNKEESVKDVAQGGGKDEDEREREKKKKGEEDPHSITENEEGGGGVQRKECRMRFCSYMLCVCAAVYATWPLDTPSSSLHGLQVLLILLRPRVCVLFKC